MSNSLSERDQQHIWHPFTQMLGAALPVPIVKGEGAYLFDENGKRYIDCIASWWVNIHGHSHPYIAQKLYEQAQALEHVIFAGFTHPKAVELAERLLTRLPVNQKKIFYSDNGSTAVEVAIKMAIQYWHNQGVNKHKIIAFKDAYHGDTFGAMSVSGRSIFTEPFQEFFFDTHYIDVPVAGHETETLQQLESILKTGEVAAFIFEPLVLGSGGMLMYEPEVLNQLIALCKQYNALTIADEVMTGFGRTGKFFATDYVTEKPDLYCLSKGLTGGFMALGVTACTQNIFDAYLSEDATKTFYHGHSFTANPLACAVACASLDLFDSGQPMQDVQRISDLYLSFFNELKTHPKIKDIRVTGVILAIEVKTDEHTSYNNSLKTQINNFFLQRGLLLRPLGNIFYLLPPYCISNEDLQYAYQGIREFLEQV